MLIRLPPEQIMKWWPEIKECISTSLPRHIRESEQSLLSIQERMLTGLFDCWISAENNTGLPLYGVTTTRFVTEEISGIKNLLIFTVTIVERHPENMWKECIEVLKRYAIAHNCTNIIAYSEVGPMINIAESLGFDTKTRLLYLKL